MIRRLVFALTLVLLGIATLVIPNFSSYFDVTSLFYFNLAKFLNDFPGFTYPFGIALILFGTIGALLVLFDSLNGNTAFVIQKANDGDYGDIDLHFPKFFIGDRDELVYQNIATLDSHNTEVMSLERRTLEAFYKRISKKKRIAFLAISPMPTVVYAGYCVANCGRQVTYCHWDRDNARAVKIKRFGGNVLLTREEDDADSKEIVVCISTSYPVEKEPIKRQFNGFKKVYFSLQNPGYNSIKTVKDIKIVADSVREYLGGLVSTERVHLLLCCSTELCFAIGQRLNSPALPPIDVYNYEKAEAGKRRWVYWNITLNQ